MSKIKQVAFIPKICRRKIEIITKHKQTNMTQVIINAIDVYFKEVDFSDSDLE